MADFIQVFDFVYNCIKDYLLLLNSSWLTQTILYTVLVGFVVSTLLILRGK